MPPSNSFFQFSVKLSADKLNLVYSAEAVKFMSICAFWIEGSCALKTLTLTVFKVFPDPSPSWELPDILPWLQALRFSSSGCQAADKAWTCPVLLWDVWALLVSFSLGQWSLCSALPFPLDFQGRSYSGDRHFSHSSSTHEKCREPDARVSMWISIYVQGSFFFVTLPLAEWKSEVGLVFLAFTSVKMEKFFIKYKGWDLVGGWGFILIHHSAKYKMGVLIKMTPKQLFRLVYLH